MRGVLVRNVGVGILALALTLLASCNDNPLSFDVKDTKGIVVTPSFMVLTAGRTTTLFSRTVNQGGEPTYQTIEATRDPACGAGTISWEVDDEVVPAEPPGRFLVTGESVLGQTCLVLTGGGATTQVDITVVANAIEITNNPGVVRAGDSGTLEARLVDPEGNELEPYDVANTVWTTDNAASVDVSGGGGDYTTSEVGTGVVTVRWLGQDENGTSGLGVDITDEAPIAVIANVPATAAFTVGTDLGAFPIGETLDYSVTVLDAEGNINTFPDEVTGVTVTSSNPGAVTATAVIETDNPDYGEGNVPVVTVTTVAAGLATISGVVQTSEGDLPYTGDILVVNPTITSIAPASGEYAATVTITGTDFVDGETQLFVDGNSIGNFTIDSPTQITAQMPTYGLANPAAPLPVYVTTVGVQSPAGPTWTQTTPFDEQSTEDNSVFISGNDAPISVPAFFDGELRDEPDDGLLGLRADRLFFTISGGTRTIFYENTPVASEDMQYDVIDGGLNFFWCFDDHTGPGSPDGGTCELPGLGEELGSGALSNGTWWLIPSEWGNEEVDYFLTILMDGEQ